MTEETAIHTRAMLVNLHATTWSARKYDRKVSRQVAQRHGTTPNAGRYNKCLLPDAVEYKALIKTMSATRELHYEQTLPWSDEGFRLLPSANFMRYTEVIRATQSKFEDELSAFEDAYPRLKEFARRELNGLYNETDYPSIANIRGRFSIKTTFSPVPASGDFRVDLTDDQLATVRAETEARVTQASKAAMRGAWDRLHEAVKRIQERLADPKAIFRDSLIGNASELVDILGRLNFTDDPQLEEMRTVVRDQLTRHDPQSLRESPTLRKATAQDANDILTAMKGLYA